MGVIVRGLGALAALTVILVGVPVALVALAPLSIPTRLPTWGEFVGVWMRPDDGSVLWGVMAVAAWACWVVFAAQVVAGLVAQVRHVELPSVRGTAWLQRSAMGLVAAVVVMLSTPTPGFAAPGGPGPVAVAELRPGMVGPGVAPVEPEAATLPREVSTRAPSPSGSSPLSPSDAGPDVHDAHPTVVVAADDTLWDLAERHLGAGQRFPEIVALNAGIRQADGSALTDAHWIEPGWVLRLPLDAVGGVPGGATAPSVREGPGGTRVVAPGDTLWEIAEDELGDGTRFPEIAELNVGLPQPDGGALADPDLIRPGWTLRLPGGAPVHEAPPAPATSESTPEPVAEPAPHLAPSVAAEHEPESPPTPRHLAPESARDAHSAMVEDDLDIDEALEREGAPAPSLELVLGITGFGAALVVAELARRRAQQRRRRRPGERSALPASGSARGDAEAALRRAVPMLTLAQVDEAMARLASGARAAGRGLPRVGVVLVDVHEMELLLVGEDENPIPPFVSAGRRSWRAPTADVLADDRPVGSSDNAYPDLVSIGQHGDATVLVNLEAAGTFSIVGDDQVATGALRAIACELTCRPLHDRLAPHVTDELGALRVAGSPDLIGASTPDERFYASQVRTYREHLSRADERDVLDARGDPDGGEGWLTAVHLGSPVPVTVAEPWCGLAVVVCGERGGWRLVVDADGAGRLEPFGLDLAVAHLSEDSWSAVVSSLAEAAESSSGTAQPGERSVPEERAVIAASLGPERETGAIEILELRERALEFPAPPRILLLGRPTVVFGDERPKIARERRLTEIVAFLAVHPGASTEQLDELLGRGRRISNASRNAYVSRARAWLGQAPDGSPYLPLLTVRDDYRLHPAVRTDWDDFRDLLRAGVEAEADGAPALRAALDLVRGRPFADVPIGTYDWAEPTIHQMIDQISDAAHLFALLAGGSDYRSVQEALAIALSADPTNELLFRDAIELALRAGDHALAARLSGRVRRAADEFESDGLEPETEALLARVAVPSSWPAE